MKGDEEWNDEEWQRNLTGRDGRCRRSSQSWSPSWFWERLLRYIPTVRVREPSAKGKITGVRTLPIHTKSATMQGPFGMQGEAEVYDQMIFMAKVNLRDVGIQAPVPQID